MKKLLFVPVLAFIAFAVSEPSTIEKKERKFAKEFLKETKGDLVKSVKGLSETQLKFKTAPDRWSVEDCMKHIAAAEMGLRQMLDNGLKQPATPEKRSEVKVTDDALIKMIEDRSFKAQAPEQIRPENTAYKTADEALASFKQNRDKLMDYVKNTKDDLRNHLYELPFGKIDGYQMVLFISAHSNRHTQQIKEVMNDPNFPKQ
ncbi:MAG TPA: DinB family protein [Chitinophagaceae bacterium]|nr:DinB family protein [Chitinophagaceae bacterium]